MRESKASRARGHERFRPLTCPLSATWTNGRGQEWITVRICDVDPASKFLDFWILESWTAAGMQGRWWQRAVWCAILPREAMSIGQF